MRQGTKPLENDERVGQKCNPPFKRDYILGQGSKAFGLDDRIGVMAQRFGEMGQTVRKTRSGEQGSKPSGRNTVEKD